MRKLTLGLANSLDNYIARKDGGFDWLHWSKEVAEISAKFMKTVDALLIGTELSEQRAWLLDYLRNKLAVAVTAVVPETVAFCAGAVIEPVGFVMSTSQV